MNKQSGFTLIELVMVIVILGILAATALPKFVDLSSDAKKAAIAGVAAGLSSGGTINYAQRSISSVAGIATSGVACLTIATGVMQSVPTGYSFTGNGPNCTVDTSPTATSAVAAYVAPIL